MTSSIRFGPRTLRKLASYGIALALGITAGAVLTYWALRSLEGVGKNGELAVASAETAEEPDYEHIDVTRAAQQSLGLELAAVAVQDYTAMLYVPAVVVERPAVSDLHVVTEFEGIVEDILAVPGQAVGEGDSLFRLRLTGDALAAAQAALLDAVQQSAILDQEIERLRPAAEQGGLAARNLLELEYERKRLLAQGETRRQELMVRGLEESQIAQIMQTGKLVRMVTVKLPQGLTGRLQQQELQGQPALQEEEWPFTVEELEVTPGSFVRPGDPLCSLAYHASLYLMGQAFERDVPAIAAALAEGHPAVAELGDARQPMLLEGLPIVHLNNHVDPVSQTYRFYVELQNEVLQESVRPDGRRFRTWRYKPGQRGHVGLPEETFADVFVLPSRAVVADGLQQIVFRRQEEPPEEGVDEFVPVPVTVLLRDRDRVVVAPGGFLRSGDVIAMNSAYQILLAMKAKDSGHDHHHHGH